MPRRRPKPPPPPPDPPAAPAPPLPATKLTRAIPGGRVRLLHDKAGGTLLVAFDRPPLVGDAALPDDVRDHLRDNGFAPPADGGGAWARPFDAGAGFSDIIDGERVVIRAAELLEEAGPTPARRRLGPVTDSEPEEEEMTPLEPAAGTPDQSPALSVLEQRIVDAAGDQLDRLDACEVGDAVELREVVQEIGYVMAIKHLAEAGGLNPAGQAEAGKVVAASREWLADRAGDGPAGGRGR